MRSFSYTFIPALALPFVLFVMLSYPVVQEQIHERLPSLTAYDISQQMAAHINHVEFQFEGIPPDYQSVLSEYGSLRNNAEFLKLRDPAPYSLNSTGARKMLTALVLLYEGLPQDFLSADPVDDVLRRLDELDLKQRQMNIRREQILGRHVLDCMKYNPPGSGPTSKLRRGLPPSVEKHGLIFCGEKVPLLRKDVRQRIEYQIDYLLTDLFKSAGIWLKRKDRYGRVVEEIMAKEGMPKEFCILPALESGYSSSVVSPSKAKGWWQFVKATAVRSHQQDEELDWSLRVNSWKDERQDLAVSTRSAARYLKWIRSRISSVSGVGSWLMTAAAYNAGLSKTLYRIRAYKTNSFWDLKLPRETEDYVPRWIALHLIDTNREFYGIEIDDISPLDFDTLEHVRLSRDLPLSVVATLSGCSIRFIREINRALGIGAGSFRAKKNGKTVDHTIHVPAGFREPILDYLKAKSYLK
jgi:membrane-bound lytic murein transglycosylase D